ncbi:MAG: PEGA domain-containing protein, partial [Xanthobacteraceae bacterium]|nr:PEGA domain-containing protein [Xanthobacteraceae bacterium]
PGFNASVHVTSVPPGAEASLGSDGQSCTTPCSLTAPNGTGTYNVTFKLNGYQPQSVPVHIAVNESSSMQTGDAGMASTTVITPDPVVAELERFAPAAMKPPAARTKPKPATTTAAISAPPPASSPPPPAPPAMPTPVSTAPAGRP